jgi:hypothetical protein
MFKFVAFVFLVLNGQITVPHVATLQSRTEFQSMQECMDYPTTPKGMWEIRALEDLAKRDEEAYKIEYRCMPLDETKGV